VYNLDISLAARKDSREILAYIKNKLFAPQAATNLADKFDECYKRLENNPYMYEVCRHPKLKELGFRRAVIKNYILLYQVFEENNLVIVNRIFHGKRDYPNLI